ncbi:MAG: hypothetical protein WKF74_07105 [Pyrinomonadaceae bacterium]
MSVADKRFVFVLAKLFTPLRYRGGIYLMLACDLRHRLTGFDLRNDLQLEFFGKFAAFETHLFLPPYILEA